MTARKDYGPAGCASGCAKRSAAAVSILGAGAWLIGLAGKASWHLTTRTLQKMEDHRAGS